MILHRPRYRPDEQAAGGLRYPGELYYYYDQ